MKQRTIYERTSLWLATLVVGAVAVTPAVLQAAEGRQTRRRSEQGVGPDRVREASLLSGIGGSHIGISIQDIEQAGLTEPDAPTEGAVVEAVREGSPAGEAGVEPGDVVVEFDGERVRSARQLSRLVQETPAGRAVSATIVRDGARVDVDVVPEAGRGWLAQFEEPPCGRPGGGFVTSASYSLHPVTSGSRTALGQDDLVQKSSSSRLSSRTILVSRTDCWSRW